MSQFRRGRWPAGLIGMLVLVAGVELYVTRHDSEFTTILAADWKHASDSLPLARTAAVIGLGDSMVKHGLVPQVLAERLGGGRTAYNFAVPAGRAPGHYFLLRRLLHSGARPVAILLDGELLEAGPLEPARLWPEMIGLRDTAELAWNARDATFLARMILAQVLPSIKDRNEIRLSVLKALKGMLPDEAPVVPIFRWNWEHNAGAQLWPPYDLSHGDPRAGLLDELRPSLWAGHPQNVAYIERLLDLAASHGIRVFWLLPPCHPEMQRRRDYYGWSAGYVRYLLSLQARHPSLTVIDACKAGYPADTIADMTHLDRVGAVTYSESLGRVLRQQFDAMSDGAYATSRWLTLPPYHPDSWKDLTSAWKVEDVLQSRINMARITDEFRRSSPHQAAHDADPVRR